MGDEAWCWCLVDDKHSEEEEEEKEEKEGKKEMEEEQRDTPGNLVEEYTLERQMLQFVLQSPSGIMQPVRD